ncbi:MAG: hypothetical protein LBM04_02675, partial [Opitutaceae bacterium]|jgi:hypothetical protein|nr:hypothetical protein [Opitutaceae bacterium]
LILKNKIISFRTVAGHVQQSFGTSYILSIYLMLRSSQLDYPGGAGIFARDAFSKYTKRAHGISRAEMPALPGNGIPEKAPAGKAPAGRALVSSSPRRDFGFV